MLRGPSSVATRADAARRGEVDDGDEALGVGRREGERGTAGPAAPGARRRTGRAPAGSGTAAMAAVRNSRRRTPVRTDRGRRAVPEGVRRGDAVRPCRIPRDIEIRGDTIRLGQLLKLAGIADSGGEARALVERGVVRVNGEVETRRGRQLHPGDEIAAEGESVRVV